MKSNYTPKTASGKSFLSFGVLSPQNRVERETVPTQALEQKVKPQTALNSGSVRFPKRLNFLRRTQ
jgi:hypothetical protein